MDNNIILDNSKDRFSVPDTQSSLATFSKKILNKLGICQSSMGTDILTNNNTTLLRNALKF